MDVLTKKKAAPKPSKTVVKEERSSDLDAGAAGDKKPGPARVRKVTKRLPSISDSDSDSDFGSKLSKSAAAKVCAHTRGAARCGVLVIRAGKAREG